MSFIIDMTSIGRCVYIYRLFMWSDPIKYLASHCRLCAISQVKVQQLASAGQLQDLVLTLQQSTLSCSAVRVLYCRKL